MVGTEFLQTHALFGGLTDRQAQSVMSMLKEERFQPRQYVFHEGDTGDKLYLICAGAVEVLKEHDCPNGKSGVLAILKEGDSFGEMELIDIQARSASIRATTAVTALTLSNSDLHSIYKTDAPAFAMILMNIAREISRRLRRMDKLYASATFCGDKGARAAG